MKKSLVIFINIFLFCLSINAQSNKVTIKVKDENNKSVSGAIIIFDDVRQKRWTNSNGIFKTKFKKQPIEITAFHPKLGIKKIKYKGEEKITLKIRPGSYSLLGSPKQKIVDTHRFNNIYDYLRARVPGVKISPSNTITIRGFNSINGSTEPLFILNNVNVDKSIFSNIVVSDIESVTILKGPETARYGVRGANGVIIVKSL